MPDDRLATPLPTFADTRLAAHRLAVYVVSPARRRATGRIGLRAGDGAVYVTPPFDGRVVRLEPGGLVDDREGAREAAPVTTLGGAAAFLLDGPPDVDYAKDFDVPDPGDLDAPLALDPAAADQLGAWYRFGFAVLGAMRDEAGGDASEIQLWPEHFDAAVDAPCGGGRITFGASPGDATSDEPYLYVLPARAGGARRDVERDRLHGCGAAAVGVRGRRRPAGRRARVPAEPPGRRGLMRRLLPEPAADVAPEEAYADVPVAAGRPGVRVNMVASLDGAITLDGRSGTLGGDADRRVFRVLRALADVVLVAAGTMRTEGYGPPILSEEAQAARRARGQARLPRIAVVTRSLQLDWGSRFFAEAPEDARPIVVTSAGAPEEGRRRAAEVADVLIAGDDDVDLAGALTRLGQDGVASVLCEGGPSLNRALAAEGLLDELCLTVSPRLVGGAGPRMLAADPPIPGGLPMRLHAAYEDDGFLFLRHRTA